MDGNDNPNQTNNAKNLYEGKENQKNRIIHNGHKIFQASVASVYIVENDDDDDEQIIHTRNLN